MSRPGEKVGPVTPKDWFLARERNRASAEAEMRQTAARKLREEREHGEECVQSFLRIVSVGNSVWTRESCPRWWALVGRNDYDAKFSFRVAKELAVELGVLGWTTRVVPSVAWTTEALKGPFAEDCQRDRRIADTEEGFVVLIERPQEPG
jgi:hypothetical protein